MKLLHQLLNLFRRPTLDAEMAEEMRLHVELQTEQNVAAGMSPDEARYAALRQFGNVASVQEQAREGRGWVWWEQLGQDLRYAFRALGRNPLFTGVAVATLALGVGANTAVYSILQSVLLRPLPYRESGRLVAIWEKEPEKSDRTVVSVGNFLDWREQNGTFEAIGAYGFFGGRLRAGGAPQSAAGARLTPGLLEMLGVRPALGRAFSENGNLTAGREIILSHGCWQSRFGGRADILGLAVHLDDTPGTVIGVMPPDFEFPARNLDFWLPLRFEPEDRESRKSHEWRVVGRLKPGMSLVAAQADMNVVAARITAAQPQFMTGWGINLVPYRMDLVRTVRPTVLILAGVVAAVLLVACANVANLMLVRAAGRQRELAIRGALGAGRGRIVRQLLTEAAVLAGTGTAAGLLLAFWAIKFLTALIPAGLPGIGAPALDAGVLGFAAITMIMATGIVGLAPVWWLSRVELRSFLQGGRAETGHVLLRRSRNALLVIQLALATTLLIGAGLLTRSMVELHRVDFGFDPKNLLTATVNLPGDRYRTTAEQLAFVEALETQLGRLPGVLTVAGISDPPLAGSSTFGYVVAGRPRSGPDPRESPVEERNVTPGYFQAAGLPLLAGRGFNSTDRPGSPVVAVVNRAFARRHFREAEAIGQRFSFFGAGGPWVEIVGMVGDVKDAGHDQAAAPAIYTAYAQKRLVWQSALTMLIRAETAPDLLQEEVRAAFAAVDGTLSRPHVSTMKALYDGRIAHRLFMTQLTGGFAGLTLILGAIGVYGVISYTVSRREREFGICVALGATRGDIMRKVMGEGIRLVAQGVLLGVGAALGLTRYLSTLLFEIRPDDPATCVGVTALLVWVSLLALWLPARRAAKVDPVVALRAE